MFGLSPICMQDTDLVEIYIASRHTSADAAAKEVYYEGQDETATENAQKDDQLSFIVEWSPVYSML